MRASLAARSLVLAVVLSIVGLSAGGVSSATDSGRSLSPSVEAPANAQVPNLTNWWAALDCDSPYPLHITVNSAPPGIGVDQLNATPLYVQGPGTGWMLSSFATPFTFDFFSGRVQQNDGTVVMPVPMHYQDVVYFRWGGGTGPTPDGTLIATASTVVGAAGSQHYGGCDAASNRILNTKASPWYCSSPTVSGTITVTTGFSGTLLMYFYKDGDPTERPARLVDLGDGNYEWTIPLLSITDPESLQEGIDNRDHYSDPWMSSTAILLIDQEPTVRYFYPMAFFPPIPFCTTDPVRFTG